MKKPDKKSWLIVIIIMCVLFLISLVGKKTMQKENHFVLQEKQTWIKELSMGLESLESEEIQESGMETESKESGMTEESGETVQIEEVQESEDAIILKLENEEELQIRKDEIIRTGDEEESAGVYDSVAYHVVMTEEATQVYRKQQEENAISGYEIARKER